MISVTSSGFSWAENLVMVLIIFKCGAAASIFPTIPYQRCTEYVKSQGLQFKSALLPIKLLDRSSQQRLSDVVDVISIKLHLISSISKTIRPMKIRERIFLPRRSCTHSKQNYVLSGIINNVRILNMIYHH